jgi:hypothetical protein
MMLSELGLRDPQLRTHVHVWTQIVDLQAGQLRRRDPRQHGVCNQP